MADSQIDPSDIQTSIYCSKLILLQSFYSLRSNISLTWVDYFMTDTMRK